jgi:NAD(P)-dependent dehydrogenase (short-subunit alcohol dehydrogenase family)
MIVAHTGKSLRAALVTGVETRIGRALALVLVKAGFAVAIQARRSAAEVNSLADAIAQAGGHAAIVDADLGSAADVGRLVHAATVAIGPLTLLVHNVPEFESDEPERVDRGSWDRQFAVNLGAPVLLADAFAAQLPHGAAGAIINVLDRWLHMPTRRRLSSTLTHCALHTATVALAQALAPAVRVNAVAVGSTSGTRRGDAGPFAGQPVAVPSGQVPCDEIAAAVLYLAAARSITGQTITVDVGRQISW